MGSRYEFYLTLRDQNIKSNQFITFVNGRSKKDILPELKSRLSSGTTETEMTTGLEAMVLIAKDRLKKLISAPVNKL